MKALLVSLVVAATGLSACGSVDSPSRPESTTTTTTTAAPVVESTTTTTASAAPSVEGIAEEFRLALNNRDVAAVAAMAPFTNADIQDFIIGGSPYPSVDCFVFEGRDECQVVNGIADFIFVVDTTTGLVTNVEYAGGE